MKNLHQTRNARFWILSALLSVVMSLAACSPIKTPNVNTYDIARLDPLRIPMAAKTQKTILIGQVVASPGFDTTAMRYMEVPYRLSSFSNNRWIAPPGDMLEPMLVEALRSQGYFKAVAMPPFSGMTDYQLGVQLLKLDQEFLLPVSRIRLAMQATLIDNRTGRVIASRRFEVSKSAPGNNPYQGVLAINLAADDVTLRIAQFVVKMTIENG